MNSLVTSSRSPAFTLNSELRITLVIPMSSLIQESDYDHETALLIAELQLEDALYISKNRKGKARNDTPLSDEELAFQLQAKELDSWKQTYQDTSLAKSLYDALNKDAEILDAFCLIEEAATADRQTAELVSRGEPLPRPTSAQRKLEDPSFALETILETAEDTPRPRRLTFLTPELKYSEVLEEIISPFDRVKITRGANQTAGPSVDRFKRVQCVGCDKKLRLVEAVSTKCQHYWCSECLVSLIEVYLRDESLHPLRCCQNPFTNEAITESLPGKALLDQFEAKRREYLVPAQNRVYCATPACSLFLGNSEERARAVPNIRCTSCQAQTCAICRKPSHIGETCTNNEAVEQVRALARESGWQTCPGCFTVVDLHHGCNHMTCTCRTEFCFVCGVRWKNCECPQWDERRLETTAEMRAQNVLGERVRMAQPEVFRREVVAMAQNLRVNHGCDWHRWRGTGPGDCEECGAYMPIFLKMCRDCNLSVCRRCSFNRV